MARVGMLGADGRRFAGEDGANYEVIGHVPGVPIGGVTVGGAR